MDHSQYTAFRLGVIALALATVWGMNLRWSELDFARGLPSVPDLSGSWGPYAREFQWFSDSKGLYSGAFGEREPFYIAALHAWFSFWGDADPSARWFTVCLSVLLVPAVGAFSWRITSQWWIGALAGIVMAINPEWINLSTHGIRDEATALLLTAMLSVWLWARGWFGAMALGTIMGLLFLTRQPLISMALSLVWGIWLVNQWRNRIGGALLTPSHWPWTKLLLATSIALTIFLPHLLAIVRIHGDASWAAGVQARLNANVEFPERLGSSGWPSSDEFIRDPYSGPSISFSQYLFGLHSLSELLIGQVKGWIESTGYMAGSSSPGLARLVMLYQASGMPAVLEHIQTQSIIEISILSLLFVLGWSRLLRGRGYQWVPIACFAGTWYAAFMYSKRLIEPFRQTCHVYPLILVCQLIGIWMVLSWAKLLPWKVRIDSRRDVDKPVHEIWRRRQ